MNEHEYQILNSMYNFLIKNGARILLFDEGDVDEMGNYGNNEL